MRDFAAFCDDLLWIFAVELGAEALTHLRISSEAYQSGRLTCTIRYPDGSNLHIHMRADCTNDPIRWARYSFQYLDARDAVLFRYDNAPSHPGLANFPHHLHLPDETRGVSQPGPREIRDRIARHLGR